MDFSALVGCVGYRMSFGWLKGKWQPLLSGIVDGFYWGLFALLVAFMAIPSVSLLVAVAMDAFHISVTSADWEAVQSFCYTGFFLGLGSLLIISNWGDLLVTVWKVEDLSIYRKCTYSSVILVVLSLGAVLFTGLCEIFVWVLIFLEVFSQSMAICPFINGTVLGVR